jgi:Nif-specific regulatory protein
MVRADTDISWVHELAGVIAGSAQFHDWIEPALRLVRDELELTRAVLYRLDEADLTLRPVSMPDEHADPPIELVGTGPIGTVAKTGQAGALPDVAQVSVPVQLAGRVLGVLTAEMPSVDQPGLDRIESALGLVADMLAPAVQSARLVLRVKSECLDGRVTAGGEPDTGSTFKHRNLVGSSRAMQSVYATLDRVATTAATILLVGETGTGKELIAKAIHANSSRKGRPFVAVNCSALPGQLLESELFGHVHGAFTGAVRDKVGRFEAAHDGTLLLDEISTMELPMQVKLLRVLQEREIERVGDVRTIPVNVRIIAATNEDLDDAVRAGTFREDLYYRLNVVVVRLPPLRERREDIPRLINHFLDKYNTINSRELCRLSQEMVDLLVRYPWPGNVRELENTIERAVVLSGGEDFTADLLPPSIITFADRTGSVLGGETTDGVIDEAIARCVAEAAGTPGRIWDRAMTLVERSLIREALDRSGQVKIKAADFLGINRNTLNKKCRELGLNPSTDRAEENAE